MSTLTIKVDDGVKREADRLYKSMGMNLSTAVNVFLRKSIQVGGMPFTPTAGYRGVRVDRSEVLVPKRNSRGGAVLPSDWDDDEDSVYDDCLK